MLSRRLPICRRNYLFAGADTGGERAAAIYSLIGTAKLNGVDPEAWLRHVLGVCAAEKTETAMHIFGLSDRARFNDLDIGKG